MLRPALQSKQSSLCGLHDSRDRGGPNGQIVSVKRGADGRRQIDRKIISEEREKYRAKNGSLQRLLVLRSLRRLLADPYLCSLVTLAVSSLAFAAMDTAFS